jgi:hypothetical protein
VEMMNPIKLMIRWSQNQFFGVLSWNTWPQTLGYISNWSYWKLLFGVEISRLRRKEKYFKIQKQLPFGKKMANYWQLFL